MMEEKSNLLNSLSSALVEYLGLRTDEFKKKIVSALSIGFSRVLSILVIVVLLMIVLAILAMAFIILIGDAIGSWSGAAFIVGGAYLIAFAVLYFLRKRLFLNTFTNLFAGIVDSGTPLDNWKSLLLIIVKNLRNGMDV